MRKALVQLWSFAAFTLVPAISLALTDDGGGSDGAVSAPELDPSSAGAALALLIAGAMVLRRTQKQS